MQNPITEVSHGFYCFIKGMRWLLKHPSSLLIVFIPMILGIGCLAAGVSLFFTYDDLIIDWLLFEKPEGFWGVSLYYVCLALLYVSSLIATLLVSVLLVNIVASPFYDIVSMRVEEDISGRKPPEISIWESIKLMGEELKKVLAIATISLALLIIPGINFVGIVLAAGLVAWDFYDYPFARRGLSFRNRFGYLFKDIWSILGMGVWFMIPFVQFLIMPLAVAGGTMLAVRRITQDNIDLIEAKN